MRGFRAREGGLVGATAPSQASAAALTRQGVSAAGGGHANWASGAGTIWLKDLNGTSLVVDNKDGLSTQIDSTGVGYMGTGPLVTSGAGVAPSVAFASGSLPSRTTGPPVALLALRASAITRRRGSRG